MNIDPLPDFLDEDSPLEVAYKYPSVDFWGSGDSLTEEAKKYLLIETVTYADVIAVTDTDADGYGSLVVIQEAFPDENVGHIRSGHRSGMPLEEVLELLTAFAPADVDIFITDISPGEEALDDIVESLERLSETTTIHFYDHHDWTEEAIRRIGSVVEDLVVTPGVCATDITFDGVLDVLKENNPKAVERMREFSEVTRDHDLWIKEDPRSNDLSDFMFFSDSPEEYVRVAREFGADIAQNEDVARILEEHRSVEERKIELMVENAEWETIEGIQVALAYGNAYNSEVGNRLCTGEPPAADAAKLAVLIPPWDKISLRSSESFPYCSLIAREFGGGGHPCAAGAKKGYFKEQGVLPKKKLPDGREVTSYRDHHWDVEGKYVKEHVVEKLETIIHLIMELGDYGISTEMYNEFMSLNDDMELDEFVDVIDFMSENETTLEEYIEFANLISEPEDATIGEFRQLFTVVPVLGGSFEEFMEYAEASEASESPTVQQYMAEL